MIKFTVICFVMMALGIVANLVLPLNEVSILNIDMGEGLDHFTLRELTIFLPLGILMFTWIIWSTTHE